MCIMVTPPASWQHVYASGSAFGTVVFGGNFVVGSDFEVATKRLTVC